jgi:hypothetical protein
MKKILFCLFLFYISSSNAFKMIFYNKNFKENTAIRLTLKDDCDVLLYFDNGENISAILSEYGIVTTGYEIQLTSEQNIFYVEFHNSLKIVSLVPSEPKVLNCIYMPELLRIKSIIISKNGFSYNYREGSPID